MEHVVVLSLGVLAAGWLVVAIVTKPASQGWDEWVSVMAMGFVNAIAGSLLTFLLIDLLLARQRDAERRESREQERRAELLARLRRGSLEQNRGVVEQLRSAGWLRDGFLQDADFSAANLEEMDFEGADLRGALFVGAHLRRASFRNADVSTARFAHADLRGARFDGARTEGADFSMSTQDDDTVLA